MGVKKGCPENCNDIGEVGWHRELGFWERIHFMAKVQEKRDKGAR